MWEIAADGVYYQQPREKGTVVLVVGSRKDVLVRLSVLFCFVSGVVMGRQNCVRNPTYTHTYPPPQQVQCPTPGAFPLTAVKDPRMVQSYMGKGTDFYEGAACMCICR